MVMSTVRGVVVFLLVEEGGQQKKIINLQDCGVVWE